MSDRPRNMFEEDDDSGVVGYMCLTDFECEVGMASTPSPVYSSIECIRRHKKCVAGCGIVEVRVVGVKIVQEASLFEWSGDDDLSQTLE